ncbi:hypothetical protein F7D09_0586 [Bifidobacterium leontopitheci]|uniref:Uncharacterized protein n=1 Tax=Bifidobacterium leontopitheci TaxID=2650774 RepID=A0A6I1GWK5_9BIFI|nr:hypothetical protein F7D09_0586 [Bifidobacterium leontopitheci]
MQTVGRCLQHTFTAARVTGIVVLTANRIAASLMTSDSPGGVHFPLSPGRSWWHTDAIRAVCVRFQPTLD